MNDQQPKRLSPSDPVPKQILVQFEELSDARARISNSLLNLEQEKIRLLAAAKRLDDQQQRLFEHVLVERGLAPTTQVEIDRSGKIHLTQPQPPAPPEPPEEEPPPEHEA